MSSIQRWTDTASLSAGPEGFSRQEGRTLQAMTNREVGVGIVMNTRLSVAHFVTTTAINHTASLTEEARRLAGGDQYLASRLGSLVDGYLNFARDEVRSLRRLI